MGMRNLLKTVKLFSFLILILFIEIYGYSYKENLYPFNIILLSKNDYAILVEKKSQKMYIYKGGMKDPLMVFTITTGKNNGDKLYEGDEKTPLGIYFFNKILEGKKLLPMYGIKAFVTNYPNPFDQYKDKDGSGIWLHGTEDPFKPLTPFSTKGCVAMRNSDLIKVSPLITLEKTPLINTEEIRFIKYSKTLKDRDFFINLLNEWKKGWESRNINRYIKYYSNDFKNGEMNYAKYKEFKARLNKIYKYIRISLSDIQIFRTDKYVLTSFYQKYRSDRTKFQGIKRLYWIKEKNGWKIIRENALANKKWINKKAIIKGQKLIKVENFRWENDPVNSKFNLYFNIINSISTPIAGYIIVEVLNQDNSGYVFTRRKVSYMEEIKNISPKTKGKFFKIRTTKKINLSLKYGSNFYPKLIKIEIYDLQGILMYSEKINM
jgi:murein L,D-transpeptidase YafK